MQKHFFILAALFGFGCFIYGISQLFVEVENNGCHMTYMFKPPQYLEIYKSQNQFPNYGLYYYYESNIPYNRKSAKLNGAPVIFIPGNGGSYKQVRSLASVALKKREKIANNVGLDFFTIDYNEELSGLHGGYLKKQKSFLKECITRVRDLYSISNDSILKVILIGHSMGGKVAQSILADPSVSEYINSIIFISSPLDYPVVNFDTALSSFYQETNAYLDEHHRLQRTDKDVNYCLNRQQKEIRNITTELNKDKLETVLMISIGGGNRDLLVYEGLTESRHSDIHVITSAIPNVWLSCDHLSAVWCLELVLVINRFLFSILEINTTNRERYSKFIHDKNHRLQQAFNFFVKANIRTRNSKKKIISNSDEPEKWIEDSRKVYTKDYSPGRKEIHYNLIRLTSSKLKLLGNVVNLDNTNMVIGCTVNNNIKYCENGIQLANYVQTVPSWHQMRAIVVLDLSKIKRAYTNWTHVAFRIPPTKTQVSLSVDIHDPIKRNIVVKNSKWFIITAKILVNETKQGSVYYKLLFEDLTESFQALNIIVRPVACLSKTYNLLTKICIPWARGFEKYQQFTERNSETRFLINVPYNPHRGYNTTKNPIVVELYLNESCRYTISYQTSFSGTMSRIARQFYHYIPAHVTAVLLFALRHQITLRSTATSLKFGALLSALLQPSSTLFLTGSRIVYKALQNLHSLPSPDKFNQSILLALFLHSTALVIAILITSIVWTLLYLQFRILSKVGLWTRISTLCSNSEFVMHVLPISLGGILISMAFYTSGGLAMIICYVFHCMKILKKYASIIQRHQTIAKIKEPIESDGSLQQLDENQETSPDNENEVDGNIQFLLALLLFLLSTINLPGTISYVRQLCYNSSPLPDPTFLSAIIVIGCLSIIWQLKSPQKLYGSPIISTILYICACICIIYCQQSLYRLNYMISFVFVIILLQQLICKAFQ